ncbi:MAG: winged helix-turn-helix transcriptional regulator [Bacilli bacterium]|nr:winged helix-turn-helix transcriptional regulator [Bacilli bacterium]
MKQIKLTKKQELVLNYIKEYTAEHGFPPAVREIAKGVGLNSPSSVHSHIKRLERDGFIKKTNSKFRTLEVVGINEFKVNNTEAVKLKLFTKNNYVSTDKTFDFPASRIPKNEEIFSVLLDDNLKEFKKNDILIITKPKNLIIGDSILVFTDRLDIITVTEKNQVFKDNVKIIGKIIELSRNI